MAAAFEKDNLDIMGYQRYQNMKADTEMRQSIAKPPEKPPGH
jgi:uncharacterized protein YqfA (UPF0365 family)